MNPVGYCIGGTLLVLTLAYLAAKGDGAFGAPTFMVSLQDYAQVGETALFMGEPAIDFVEQQMMERGYLDSREMANMFSLLRSNDLIWANVVNNYLMGNPPPAFDLLYWNSDGTRMARAAHSWYLRNTYVENNLIKAGHIVLMDEPIDLGRITQDIYAVGAESDHIVPWYAAWRITQLVGGKVRFVMASSGHIAGIINPVASKKGAYWVDETGRPAAGPRNGGSGPSATRAAGGRTGPRGSASDRARNPKRAGVGSKQPSADYRRPGDLRAREVGPCGRVDLHSVRSATTGFRFRGSRERGISGCPSNKGGLNTNSLIPNHRRETQNIRHRS